MRVLFITPYPPERDGIGTYSQMICEELARQGHHVGVLCARPTATPAPEVIGSLPGPGRPVSAAVAAARRFAPDVVHVQFAVAAYGTRLPALVRVIDRLREDPAPIVMTLHEVTRDVESLGRIGRALYGFVARRADRVVVHTETAVQALATVDSRLAPATVIAHPRKELPRSGVGVAELRRRYGLRQDRIVLSFGFIDVDKGISDLIAAAGLLNREGVLDDVRIVVAGAVRRRFGPLRVFEVRDRLYFRRLKRSVAQLGLGTRVTFVGFVPTEEMRAWFDIATVAVLAYRRIEQSGVASLASGAGTPMLTTNVGELASLGTFGPVAPGDPPALARELRACLQTSDDAVTPRRPNGDLVEIVSEMTDLYARLTEPKLVGAPVR